jgi:hypothetical protein
MTQGVRTRILSIAVLSSIVRIGVNASLPAGFRHGYAQAADAESTKGFLQTAKERSTHPCREIFCRGIIDRQNNDFIRRR